MSPVFGRLLLGSLFLWPTRNILVETGYREVARGVRTTTSRPSLWPWAPVSSARCYPVSGVRQAPAFRELSRRMSYELLGYPCKLRLQKRVIPSHMGRLYSGR